MNWNYIRLIEGTASIIKRVTPRSNLKLRF